MRITQGTFSFLPDFTDEEIEAQIRYSLRHGWAISSSTPTTPTRGTPTGRCGALPLFDLKPDEVGRGDARGARLPRGVPRATTSR